MVKFQNELDDDFQRVASHIDLIIQKAQDQVVGNWAHCDEVKSVVFVMQSFVSYQGAFGLPLR